MDREQFEKRKKMIYELICDELYVPMKIKEMAILLSVPKEKRQELQEVLDALIADGKVEVSKKGKYIKAEGNYITGTFTSHQRGYGFVAIEGEEEDIFIPAEDTGGAFHKDVVQITVSSAVTGRRKDPFPWDHTGCRNL